VRQPLRGNGCALISRDLAICGFDNGRLMSVTLGAGAVAWEVAVGQAHGSTEIQRLIDVDAPVVSDGDDLFAVGYQGRVVRLARDSGQVLWARDLSSYRGLAVTEDAVYVSGSEGDVVRLDCRTRREWRQSFVRRGLSAPAVVGDAVVVGDLTASCWSTPATALLARAGPAAASPRRRRWRRRVLAFDDDGGLAFCAPRGDETAMPLIVAIVGRPNVGKRCCSTG
jgi:outer membrane protein assembly factor BamB